MIITECWTLGRAIFVADARMNSEDNRAELDHASGIFTGNHKINLQ